MRDAKYVMREALLRALNARGREIEPEPEDTTDHTPSDQVDEADRRWWAERTREEETTDKRD